MRTSLVLTFLSLVAVACSAAPATEGAEESASTAAAGAERFTFPRPIHLPPPVVFQPKADLVAVNDAGNVPGANDGYTLCARNASGAFVVHVKNQGILAAPASITVVSGGNGSVAIPTPAIGPGQTVDVTADFERFAFCGPDCFFTITVDAAGQVVEFDEANAFSGWCIG
jgi:hypothetical protein